MPDEVAKEEKNPTPAEPPQTSEEITKPHALAEIAEALAKKRRRTTAAEVYVKRPKQGEVRVLLDREETVIGRDDGCDIVITDEKASRRHASIRRSQTGYFELTDLASHNGTWNGDEPIEKMTLQNGDVFSIGDTRFRMVIGDVVSAAAE